MTPSLRTETGLTLNLRPAEQWPATAGLRLGRLNGVLNEAWASNSFYNTRWRCAGVVPAPLKSLAQLASYPLITRADLIADQTAHPPLGSNLTFPPSALTRCHRSSGTTGAALRWADSPESWQWVVEGSQRLWKLAGLQPEDRVLLVLPCGASSGPWIIHEGCRQLGCACHRVRDADVSNCVGELAAFRPTVLAGPATLLQSLAFAARAGGVPPCELAVRKLILCGAHEISLRASLEQLWAAECFDRYGLTEAGSVAAECPAHCSGLHLLDGQFIAESIVSPRGEPAADGEPGELVLTTLGRLAQPIVRYRTGDRVRLVRDYPCACGRRGAMLLGGVSRMAAAWPGRSLV